MVVAFHLVFGWLYMLASFFLAAWAYRFYRRRGALPPPFWRALRGTQYLFGLEVLVGLTLLLAFQAQPPTKLHFMYAALALFTVIAQIALGPNTAPGRRAREEGTLQEAGAYAILTLLAALFALRLVMTGMGLP